MFQERLYDAGPSAFKVLGVEKGRVLQNYTKDRMLMTTESDRPQINTVNHKVIEYLISAIKKRDSEDNTYTCRDANGNTYIAIYSRYMREFTVKNQNGDTTIMLKDELVDIFFGLKEPYEKITADSIYKTKHKFDTYNGDVSNVTIFEDGVLEYFITNTEGDSLQDIKRLYIQEIDLENIYLSVFVNKEPEVRHEYFGEEGMYLMLLRTEDDNYQMIIEDENDVYIDTDNMNIISTYIPNQESKRETKEESEFYDKLQEI